MKNTPRKLFLTSHVVEEFDNKRFEGLKNELRGLNSTVSGRKGELTNDKKGYGRNLCANFGSVFQCINQK